MTRTASEDRLATQAPASASSARWERRLAVVLVACAVGYLVMGRTFAYLGVPQVNLFLGELLLVLLVAAPATRRTYLAALRATARPGRWHVLVLVVLAVLLYGIAQAVRGWATGLSTLDALKNLPYNYYPLFLFAGLWLGARHTWALRATTLWLGRVNAVYGAVYVLLLSRVPLTLPGQVDVPLFGNGNAAGLAIIGLLAFHRSRRETGPLIVLNGFVMLGLQQRSEWLGFAAALLVWCLLTRHVKAFLQASGGVLGLLTVVSVLGITIPGAGGRGGEISLGGVFGRTVAAVDPSLAARFVPDSEIYASTASWRTTWWSAIWEQTYSSPVVTILGNGYGYELRQLAGYVPEGTRTPHNVFFYALGYTGWLGVLLTVVLWVVLGRMLWQVYRRTGQPFGIAVAVYAFGLGMFGNWFETPFGALPTYLLLGLCLSPLLTGEAADPPARVRPRAALRAPAPRQVPVTES